MVFTNMLKCSGSMFTPTREKAVSQNSLWEHREPDSVSTTHNSAFQFFVCRRVHFYLLAINAWQECGDGVVTIDYWIWYSGLAKHPRKLTDFSRICLCRQLEYHSTLDVESTFNSISQFRIITTIVQLAFFAYFHFLCLVGKDLRLSKTHGFVANPQSMGHGTFTEASNACVCEVTSQHACRLR